MEHVFFSDADSYNLQNSLIVHHGYRRLLGKFNLFIKDEVHVKCWTGKNILVSNQTFGLAAQNSQNVFMFLTVSCSFCPRNSYGLNTSNLDSFSQNQSIQETNIKCHHCPLGGVCERGKIRAADNFWGDTNGEEVQFASCPFGYCCSKKECLSYSSCHIGRTGILCGQCEEGLTENLVTPDCLRPDKCQHPWYLLVAIIWGTVYVTAFLYLNEVMRILNVCLVPRSILEYLKYNTRNRFNISEIYKHMLQFINLKSKDAFSNGCHIQYLTDDIFYKKQNVKQQKTLNLLCATKIIPFVKMLIIVSFPVS